jgi:hypothetical protein
LFNATSLFGSFDSISLPPLAPGLFWLNRLLVDGSIEVVGPIAISLSSGSYTQNFDSLSMSGANNSWSNNFTLHGWYAAEVLPPTNITTYIASDGSANNGALYSFGSTGSPDRALGSIASGATEDISFGLCFINDTARNVTSFRITYTGEQWRNNGSGLHKTVTFWYRVSPSAQTNPEPGIFTNWMQVTNLNFTNPNTSVGAGFGALNGNAPTNRQVFSAVPIPGLTVPSGQTVFFRWHDDKPVGADNGLGVDDLVMSFGPMSPRFTSIISTGGVPQLTGLGEFNATYGIEAATNLASPIFWQRIGSNTADGAGLFRFTDTNAAAFPVRFYRLLSP